MPKSDQDLDRNDDFKSTRRQARKRVTRSVSRPQRRSSERHLSVRGELRKHPQTERIAEALVAWAIAQAEADAAQQQESNND